VANINKLFGDQGLFKNTPRCNRYQLVCVRYMNERYIPGRPPRPHLVGRQAEVVVVRKEAAHRLRRHRAGHDVPAWGVKGCGRGVKTCKRRITHYMMGMAPSRPRAHDRLGLPHQVRRMATGWGRG
jgi:hypothetical protein